MTRSSLTRMLTLLVGALVLALASPSFAVIMLKPNGDGTYNAYERIDTQVTYATAITNSQVAFPGYGSIPASAVIGHLADYHNSVSYETLVSLRPGAPANVYIGLTDDPALAPAAFEEGNTSGRPLAANGTVADAGPAGLGNGDRGAGWAFVAPNALSVFHQRTPGVSVWAGGEPNGGTSENAAEIRSDGFLNDIGQTNTRPYIREWDLNLNLGVVANPGFNTRMIRLDPSDPAGFNVNIDNNTEALAIYNNVNGVGDFNIGGQNYRVDTYVDSMVQQIDYNGGGQFGVNNPYPSAGGDDFLIAANTFVGIPAGTWTIAFASDDGGIIDLNGVVFSSTFNEDPTGGQGVGTDTVRFEGLRGHSWTGGTFTIAPGQTFSTAFGDLFATDLFAMFFERGGGDSWELAIAPGTENAFNANTFVLLEDLAYGWRVSKDEIQQLVPEPASLALLGLGGLALLRRRRNA